MSTEQQPNDDNSSTGFDITTNTVDDRKISDNVASDLIEYSRGRTIRNEKQSYLLFTSWCSGWMSAKEHYVNVVTLGSPSAGKTHTTEQMKELLPTNSYYSATDVSEAGIYNDNEKWNSKKVAIFSEWNKLSKAVREVIKSLAGDDGGAERTKSTQEDESTEWEAESQSLESKPYSFCYAQHNLTNEISDRLFFNYISEDIEINRAVVKQKADLENIQLEDGGVNYIYDTEGLSLALKRHFREMPDEADVFLPEYIYYAMEPCLDYHRSDVTRTGAMLTNFVRCSALANYHNRPTKDVEEDGQTVEKIVALPQDFCNIFSCREVLLGTTHSFSPRKQSIVDAVRSNTESSEYCSLNDVHSWIEANSTDVSKLKKDPLRKILEELEDEFVIEVSDGHFSGNKKGYKFLSLSDVGTPKLTGFNESAIEYESSEPLLGVDDPDDPFHSCTDPFSEQDFKTSVNEFRERLRSSVSSNASAAMQGSGDDGSGPQSTLDGDTADSRDVDLTPVESVVYDRALRYADGKTFQEDVAHEDVLGLKNDDGGLCDEDTILDPDHDAWGPNSGVSSVSDANRGVEDALESLMAEGVVTFVATDDGVGRIDVQEVDT